ncbi:MAG TPA: hypothetical protein VHE33_21420 [Acidobacteriaceae bacterium]|nr:hypothetical protein [Acidobacteriaceae bacterium]
MDYTTIKQLSKRMGVRVTDLIALAPQNDPFYTGTPNDWVLAEWFAALWRAFGYGEGVHLRRIHYQIISQDPPMALPNGELYENTMECWDVLNLASKAARYLGLVSAAAFVDRRNADAVEYAEYKLSTPEARVWDYLSRYDFRFPDFPSLPRYTVTGYEASQGYHLEIWCEKSTMNDILLPLCQEYGANLQIGSGELSITAALSLVGRLERAGRPARIFYVSDFDPAGQSMPVAMSRKVEYFVQTLGLDLDIRVFPVVLTLDQVREYGLPRTPIKETERRRAGFEARHGEGAVELDALEALYPGCLASILRAHMDAYYDHTLEDRVRQVEEQLRADLAEREDGVLGAYEPDIEALKQEHEVLKQQYAEQMEGYMQRLRHLWQAIGADLRANLLDARDYPVPLPSVVEDLDEGLYNSRRDYLEQIAVYKEFQGKGTELVTM